MSETLNDESLAHDLAIVLRERIRWAELKQYLRDRITAETPVMEGFRGEITGAASGGIVSACRFALAEMKRLENER